MTRIVNLNFEDRYDIKSLTADLSIYSFYITLLDGSTKNIRVEIKPEKTELPEVYSLCFGPLNSNGQIDDQYVLQPLNKSKLYSTILFYAGAYLRAYPERMIGMDLIDTVVFRNYDFLSRHFLMYGVKYFVRFKLPNPEGVNNPFDFSDIYPVAVPIRRGLNEMYNYYLFRIALDVPGYARWHEVMEHSKAVGRAVRQEDFSPIRSSLYEVIRTKGQAERFMKQLH